MDPGPFGPWAGSQQTAMVSAVFNLFSPSFRHSHVPCVLRSILSSPSHDVEVAFCCDEAYLQPLTVAIKSMLATSRAPGRIRIWVAGKQLGAAASAQLHAVANEAGARLVELPVEHAFAELPGAAVSGHLSLATYYRLLLPDLLPRNVSRLLYLHCDLLVRHPIEALYNQNLGGKALGAVVNPPMRQQAALGLAEEDGYFNAGVLLMDLERWRAQGLHRRSRAYIEAHPGGLVCHDQDALNAMLRGNWQRLDPRWNQQFSFFMLSAAAVGLSRDSIRRARRDPYIVHFTTDSKPWQATNAHPFRREYFAVLDQTMLRGWRPAAVSLAQRCECWLRRMLPVPLWPSLLRNRYRPVYKRMIGFLAGNGRSDREWKRRRDGSTRAPAGGRAAGAPTQVC